VIFFVKFVAVFTELLVHEFHELKLSTASFPEHVQKSAPHVGHRCAKANVFTAG